MSTSRWQARDSRSLLGTLALGGPLLLFLAIVGCVGGGGDPIPPPCRARPPGPSALPPPYPLASSNLEEFADFPRDADGVIYDPRYDGYHPTLVARYALTLYAYYYETGDADSLADFLAQARSLRDRFVKLGGFGVWQFEFDYEPFEASAPWVSALMQAWGLTVMLEAAALEAQQSDAYQSVASQALDAFQVTVADGGVRYAWEDGTIWYEEYATPLESRVLNGFIFALAALYEYSQQTGDEGAEALFTQGVDALRVKVGEYDKGFASAYDMHYYGNTTGKGGYHTLHIDQLLWVYCVTGDEFFWDTAKEWVNYDGWSWAAGPFVSGVEASFELDDPTFAATNLIDNTNYYGYWSSRLFPVAITLDLGQVQREVSQVVFFAFSEESAPGAFTVDISTDGVTWARALTVTEESAPATIRGDNHTDVHHTEVYGYPLEKPGDARYVQVTIEADRGARNVALREVMVHFDQAAHTQEIYEELLLQFDRPPPMQTPSPLSP